MAFASSIAGTACHEWMCVCVHVAERMDPWQRALLAVIVLLSSTVSGRSLSRAEQSSCNIHTTGERSARPAAGTALTVPS